MDNNLNGTVSATLWVESDHLRPDTMTDCLGHPPTSVQIKGDLTISRKARFKKNFWSLSFGEHDAISFDGNVLPKIREFMNSRREKLVKLRDDNGCKAWLTLAVHQADYHIGVLFDPKDILAMAEAGVGLDLSIY